MAKVSFFLKLQREGKLQLLTLNENSNTPLDSFYHSRLARFSDLFITEKFYNTPVVYSDYSTGVLKELPTNIGAVLLFTLYKEFCLLTKAEQGEAARSEFYLGRSFEAMVYELLCNCRENEYLKFAGVDRSLSNGCDKCGHQPIYQEDLITITPCGSEGSWEDLHFWHLRDELPCWDWVEATLCLEFLSLGVGYSCPSPSGNFIKRGELLPNSYSELLQYEAGSEKYRLLSWCRKNIDLLPGVTLEQLTTFTQWGLVPRSWVFTPAFLPGCNTSEDSVHQVKDLDCLPIWWRQGNKLDFQLVNQPNNAVERVVREGFNPVLTDCSLPWQGCIWAGSSTPLLTEMKVVNHLTSERLVRSLFYKHGICYLQTDNGEGPQVELIPVQNLEQVVNSDLFYSEPPF